MLAAWRNDVWLSAPTNMAPLSETEPVTHAIFPITPRLGAFFRVELVDFDGRRAFSRASPTKDQEPAQ